MAAATAEGPTTVAPAKLADDFTTWYSGVTWTWKPNKAEKAECITEAVLLEKRRVDAFQPINARVTAPPSSLQSITQSLISENPTSTNVPAIPADEGRPIYTVAPYFEVKKSPKGGYGAFALQDIPPYTEILFEHSLLQAKTSNIIEHFEDLSPSDKEIFLRLASFDELNPNKIVAIFKTNRFEVCGGDCAIFPIASRFNHACFPLCAYEYNAKTQQLVLRTKKDISKDQEITISYGQTGDELFYSWGFICDCGKCFPTANIKW